LWSGGGGDDGDGGGDGGEEEWRKEVRVEEVRVDEMVEDGGGTPIGELTK
jgi:hypothetical protein